MSEIKGRFYDNAVDIGGKELDISRSLKLRLHSPSGVAWGYHGSGPSQLALALLLEFGATDDEALLYYQDFKRDVIAKLPQEDFTISSCKVTDWLEARRIFAKAFETKNE